LVLSRTRQETPSRPIAAATATVIVAATSGLLIASAAARAEGAPQGQADIAVSSVRTSSSRSSPDRLIRLTINIRDDGPGPAANLIISLRTLGGLRHPKLVLAPPDTIEVGCTPPANLGEVPNCGLHPVPSACRESAATLTCSYAHLVLAAPGAVNNSLSIRATAETGHSGNEVALASATSSSADPNPANNHSRALLVVVSHGRATRTGARSSLGTEAGRLPIRPAHGRSFLPAVGDWEGVADGYPASFQLAYKPIYRVFRRPPYGFEDLTMIEPASCPTNTDLYSESVIGEQPFITPLGPGGAFSLASYHLSGGLRGPTVASLSTHFNTDPEHGSPACKGTLTWAMHPASRHRVDDGTWTLRLANGESETVTVRGGGRLVIGFSFPAALGQCGGPFGGVDLFIPPSGAAVYNEPVADLTVSLNFTGARTASGQITATTTGCGVYTLAMTGSLTKAAA
jgi:hypothetical protein